MTAFGRLPSDVHSSDCLAAVLGSGAAQRSSRLRLWIAWRRERLYRPSEGEVSGVYAPTVAPQPARARTEEDHQPVHGRQPCEEEGVVRVCCRAHGHRWWYRAVVVPKEEPASGSK